MFNVGDKVRVRADLKVGMSSTNAVVHEMLEYAGLETTITDVVHLCRGIEYELGIDNGKWSWDSEMLIPIEEIKPYNEEDSVRLAKAVCEYEEIVHSLEKELNNMLENKNTYKAMYQEMLDRHNNLKDEYNALVDEYNALVDDYNNLI